MHAHKCACIYQVRLSPACALAKSRHGGQFMHTPSVAVYVWSDQFEISNFIRSMCMHVFEVATSGGLSRA